MKNLIIKPRASDYLQGVNSPIPFKAVSNGIWKVWFDENQRNPTFDDDGCVCYLVNKSIDSQMDVLWPTLPKDMQDKLNQFLDVGIDGQLHFHSSPRFTEIMTGNGMNGNSMPEACDAVRHFGLVPWTSLPFTQTMIQQEYFAPANLTQMLALGQKVLSILGGKDFLRYHWLWQNAPKNMSLMQSAMLQAPVGVGIAVSSGWNQNIPTDPPADQQVQHGVMVKQVEAPACDISDNYIPYTKVLDSGYPIPFCMQAIVSPIIPLPPLPAPLPPNPTPVQAQSWIQQVMAWVNKVAAYLNNQNK